MIVIAGKNNIAVHGLKLALDRFDKKDVAIVVNKSDRGVDAWQRSLLKASEDNGVEIKTLDEVYNSDVSVFLSLEFDRIVDPSRINTDRIYNLHFSMLPRYKGMYTSVWPILFGDKESGVTLHKIDPGIDTGDVVAQKSFPIDPNDRSQDCYRKYIEASIGLLEEKFSLVSGDGDVEVEPQASEFSTYFSSKSIDFSSLVIDFWQTAWQVKRQVYAFSFRPYQLLGFEGKEVSDVVITEMRSYMPPGTLVNTFPDRFVVSTIDFDVELYLDDLDSELNRISFTSIHDFSMSLHRMLGVNDKNDKGWSPIIVAAYHGRKDIVDFLLDRGANINDQNYRGTTVLMYAKDYALKKKDSSMISFLLERGADINLKDWSGKAVRDYVSAEEADFLGL